MEPQRKTTCSFCNEEADLTIKSVVSGKTICRKCVYRSLEIVDLAPPGSVYCACCKATALRFKTNYGNNYSATWAFAGLDSHNNVIYVLVESRGSFTGKPPTSAVCLQCYKSIPVWTLQFNAYLQQTHHSGLEEPV